MIAFVRDCILNRAMRVLTNYRWFMSRPLWYVAIQHKLFSIGRFLWFSFFSYFYVSLSFLHRRVFFVLKWFAWRLRMRTGSGQQTGTENQQNWRKIWRKVENVNNSKSPSSLTSVRKYNYRKLLSGMKNKEGQTNVKWINKKFYL